MSMMEKIKHMLKGHEDQTSKAVDKAGDTVDEKTEGRYSSQVDTAQDKIKDEFGNPPQ